MEKSERDREREKRRSMKAGGTPRASICLAWAQKSLVFHPAAPGEMLFQAAQFSMKNSFMWKSGDGGNQRRGNEGSKKSRKERREEGKEEDKVEEEGKYRAQTGDGNTEEWRTELKYSLLRK